MSAETPADGPARVPTVVGPRSSAPARIAGSSADVAQSMVVATWNGGIAVGAFVGGVALDAAGVWLLPWLTIALLALSVLLVASSRAAFARVG